MGRPLKIAKAQAILTITDTDASTEEVTVSQDLLDPTSAAYGVIKGMPFVPASTTGGLTANTTYWILSITGNSTFTASATDLSANPNSTPVNLSATSGTTVSATVAPVDVYFNNPIGGTGFPATNSNTYSVVGGNTAIIGPQILARVAIGVTGAGTITCADDSPNLDGVGTDFANTLTDGTIVTTTDGTVLGYITDIANANAVFATFDANATSNVSGVGYVYATNEPGYIVRQKGKQKYLVKGTTTGLVGACFTANVANANLTPNTMRMVATYANAATQTVQSISDHTGELFTATSGPVATGNIVFQNAAPVFATFNSAAAANASAGQPYPLVTISNA